MGAGALLLLLLLRGGVRGGRRTLGGPRDDLPVRVRECYRSGGDARVGDDGVVDGRPVPLGHRRRDRDRVRYPEEEARLAAPAARGRFLGARALRAGLLGLFLRLGVWRAIVGGGDGRGDLAGPLDGLPVGAVDDQGGGAAVDSAGRVVGARGGGPARRGGILRADAVGADADLGVGPRVGLGLLLGGGDGALDEGAERVGG